MSFPAPSIASLGDGREYSDLKETITAQHQILFKSVFGAFSYGPTQ
jgi:hypothetical protein